MIMMDDRFGGGSDGSGGGTVPPVCLLFLNLIDLLRKFTGFLLLNVCNCFLKPLPLLLNTLCV